MDKALCAAGGAQLQYEAKYFWYRNEPAWKPALLPDPRRFGELPPCQLAVPVSLAEALAMAFNWRYQNHLRRCDEDIDWDASVPERICVEVFNPPAWASPVPRLPELFLLDAPDPKWLASGEGYTFDWAGENRPLMCPFWKRNIFTDTGAMRTV